MHDEHVDPIPGGYSLPNGWRITPAGKAIHTEDLILNLTSSDKPTAEWTDSLPATQVDWTGLAMHPKKNLLYAANRGNDPRRGHVSAFDTTTGKIVQQITVDVSLRHRYGDGESSEHDSGWRQSERHRARSSGAVACVEREREHRYRDRHEEAAGD